MRDRGFTLYGLAVALLIPGRSALAQATGAGSEQSQNSAASAPAAAAVTPDYAHLNPAFLLSPGDCSEWIAEGQKMADKGKKIESLTREYRRTPTWTRGKHGKADANVWCYNFGGGYLKLAGFRAASLYEQPDAPGYLTRTGGCYRALDFQVVLTSEPKSRITWFSWADVREANAADVRALKFVLSDDKGDNFTAEPGSTNGQNESGTETFTGLTPVQTYVSGTTTGTARAYGYGDSGSASAVASGSTTSTFTKTEFVPYSEDHPYYRASYSVAFPLFDDQGHPLITADVKTLTLHIVTEGGEMSVVYKLAGRKG